MRSISNLNDQQLIQLFVNGDATALEDLINRHKDRIFTSIVILVKDKNLAEDIFQEAFIKIFKHIHTLENIDAVNYWVKSTVIRTAIDHYRHAIHEREQMGYEQAADIIDGDEDIFSSRGREQILQVINALPDGYRLVINLYLIDGYNHIEIAEMLNVTEGTSKSQLSRGRNLLKKELLKIGYQKV